MGNGRSHYWQHPSSPILYTSLLLALDLPSCGCTQREIAKNQSTSPCSVQTTYSSTRGSKLGEPLTASVCVVRDRASHCGMAGREKPEPASRKLLLAAINMTHGKRRKFGDAFRADREQSTCSKPKGLESFQSCFASL